jgi:TRAP-type C4-dicarboxylate transport system substrate-binding protein
MPGGLYRGSFAVIMSQEKFDSLPEDVQKALDEQVFGEPASRMAGASWDESDTIAYEATKNAEGTKITPASDDDIAKFEEISKEVTDKVLAELQEAGVDAKAAYEMVKQEMAGN